MIGRFYRDLNVAHIAQWIAEQGRVLEPQRDEAETFLKHLDKPGAVFSFRTFSDSAYTRSGAHDPLEKALHGSISNCWDELVRLNKKGAVVTVTVNRTNGRGREIGDITHVRALFIDDDLGGDPQSLTIPPHIRVETSPHHFHNYWLVKDLGLNQFQACQQRLAKRYQGDSRVQALNQAMQLPGFWRRKQISQPRFPRVVETAKARPLNNQQLEKLLGPVNRDDSNSANGS